MSSPRRFRFACSICVFALFGIAVVCEAQTFRGGIFNVFNITNWANPGSTVSSSTSFGLLTNTRAGGSAPGIGSGEPRNVQLAAKLLF